MIAYVEMPFPAWWGAWIAYASAGWRDCHLVTDDAAAMAYVRVLRDLAPDDLLGAVDVLMRTEDRFPHQAKFRSAAEGLAEARRINEAQHEPPSYRPRLRNQAPPVEERWRTEAVAFCQGRGDGDVHLGKLLRDIDAACDGPFSRRMRGLLDKSDQQSTEEFLAETFPAGGERSSGPAPQSIGEAMGVPRGTPEELAVVLCDRRARGESIDVAALDPEVRQSARVEWVRRHPQGVAV